MPSEYSADNQRSERRIDDPAIVRERVLGIINHNTGGPQPSAARVSAIVGIAARAHLAPATVRSVLDELAAEGEIERHSTDGRGSDRQRVRRTSRFHRFLAMVGCGVAGGRSRVGQTIFAITIGYLHSEYGLNTHLMGRRH